MASGVSAGALRFTRLKLGELNWATQTGWRLKLGGSDPALRLDDCLIDEHDRDVVLHRIDSVTLLALQAFWLLAVFELLLAFRTNQNIE